MRTYEPDGSIARCRGCGRIDRFDWEPASNEHRSVLRCTCGLEAEGRPRPSDDEPPADAQVGAPS